MLKSKRKKTHSVRKGITVAFLMLVAFWLVSLIWSLAGKAVFAWQTANITALQAQALVARKHSLEKRIEILNTPRGREAAIRTAFGVARPGEQVIIVVPSKPTVSVKPKTSWWRQALKWIEF